MSSDPSAQVCPVDHKSREVWFEQARQQKKSPQSTQPPHSTAPPPPPIPDVSAQSCPVDHKSREAWLDIAKQQNPSIASPHTKSTTPSPSPPLPTTCDSSTMTDPATTALPPSQRPRGLSNDREISTIPRSFLTSFATAPSSDTVTATPTETRSAANSESPSDPHTSPSGNWIYPSESMFFAAMRRKQHRADPKDMSSVIPIHNAVNERTWHEIRAWEAGRGAETCGGPKLVSFSGDSKALTPRARMYGWMGYAAPFDRHDWVVDRCGTKVEYVIDFYAGKPVKGGRAGEGLSFYLDVRPKLNSWEGCRMRIARTFGM